MRGIAWVVGMLAALGLVWAAGPAWAKPLTGDRPAGLLKPPRPAAPVGAGGRLPTDIPPARLRLADWPDAMGRELKLTDQQQVQAMAAAAAGKDALDAWDAEHKGELGLVESIAKAARKEGDAAEADTAEKRVKELRAERDKLEADVEADVLAALTPEQRTRWEGYRLYLGLLAALIKARMTGNQEEQVRTMADAAAADLLKSHGDEARAAVRRQLLERVIHGVLTDQQRRQLAADAPPPPPGADRPDKAAKLIPGDRPDKPEKLISGDRPDKAARLIPGDKPDKAAKLGLGDRGGRPNRPAKFRAPVKPSKRGPGG